jgi:hypothetical protein
MFASQASLPTCGGDEKKSRGSCTPALKELRYFFFLAAFFLAAGFFAAFFFAAIAITSLLIDGAPGSSTFCESDQWCSYPASCGSASTMCAGTPQNTGA